MVKCGKRCGSGREILRQVVVVDVVEVLLDELAVETGKDGVSLVESAIVLCG